MDDQTVFYILGGALVVVALVLSALGLRMEKFPGSRPLQAGVSVAVAALVLATASFAWMSAEEEQEHREAELAHAAEENAAEGEEAEALEEEGEEAPIDEATTTAPATDGGGGAASAEQGAQLFSSAGCGGCHTLADAGTTATTGPDLDSALQGQTPEFIKTSIEDPNQVVAEGYPPDLMPQDYAETLSAAEIDALVAYLSASTQ